VKAATVIRHSAQITIKLAERPWRGRMYSIWERTLSASRRSLLRPDGFELSFIAISWLTSQKFWTLAADVILPELPKAGSAGFCDFGFMSPPAAYLESPILLIGLMSSGKGSRWLPADGAEPKKAGIAQ
jgi:hypothetical protein